MWGRNIVALPVPATLNVTFLNLIVLKVLHGVATIAVEEEHFLAEVDGYLVRVVKVLQRCGPVVVWPIIELTSDELSA